MSHKKETLARVVKLLEKDYPKHAYALDTRSLEGTRADRRQRNY
jgi:hypothetical protein